MGHLRRRFGALLLLQIPVAATSLMEPAPPSGVHGPVQLILILSIFFPIFVFLSTLSSTSTFLLLSADEAGSPISPAAALSQAFQKTPRWFPVGLLFALLTIPGAFAPILIPIAVYFSAIYGFAPFLAVEDTKLPFTLCFHRSKKIVSKALWQMLLIAGLLMVLEFAMAFGSADLGAKLSGLAQNEWMKTLLSSSAQFMLSLVTSLFVSPFLVSYYFKLRSLP